MSLVFGVGGGRCASFGFAGGSDINVLFWRMNELRLGTFVVPEFVMRKLCYNYVTVSIKHIKILSVIAWIYIMYTTRFYVFSFSFTFIRLKPISLLQP